MTCTNLILKSSNQLIVCLGSIKSANPINKEIERLALEEQELYKQICLNHPDLTEDQIVECVKERLLKENL